MSEDIKPKNSKAKLAANARYNKKAYVRTTLTMKPDDMAALDAHCEQFGYSKNGFATQAIKEKIQRDLQEKSPDDKKGGTA